MWPVLVATVGNVNAVSIVYLPALIVSPPATSYVMVYSVALQLGLYVPSFWMFSYPVLQSVVYLHTLFTTDNSHVAPVPAEHGVHADHTAYKVTVAPFAAVRFLTDSLSVYVTAPVSLVAQPVKV